MQVILIEDVDRLGRQGEIIEVKNGFARNYLIPQNKARLANKGNLKMVEQLILQSASKEAKVARQAEGLAKQMEGVSCTAVVAVGDDDQLFGSVSAQTIADLIKEKGFDIDRRQIVLDEPIRSLGIYTVPIRLHSTVEIPVKLWVIKGSE